MEDRTINYKTVYFDLPFLIFVRDGFRDKTLEDWVEAYQKGEENLPVSPYVPNDPHNQMIIGGGLPVYIPQGELAHAYVVKLDNLMAGVQFLRRINQNNPARLCGEIIGDRTGRASFSTVRVNFPLEQFDKSKHWNTKLFVSLAVDFVNKFLSNYRAVTERFYISPVTPAVIQNFIIQSTYDDGDTRVQTYATDKSVIDIPDKVSVLDDSMYLMDATLHGMGGAISEEKDEFLRRVLREGKMPPILMELDLEVQNKLDLREWRLAVLESAILFETYLNTILRAAYRKSGLKTDEIERKFLKNVQKSIPLSCTAIAKSLVKDAIGLDFESTEEFQAWARNTRDLRNDIVHGKKFHVSDAEARLSCDSVKNAMDLLSQYI